MDIWMFSHIQIPNVSYFWYAQQIYIIRSTYICVNSAEFISQYIAMISIERIVQIVIALVRTANFVFDVIDFIHDDVRSYPMHG